MLRSNNIGLVANISGVFNNTASYNASHTEAQLVGIVFYNSAYYIILVNEHERSIRLPHSYEVNPTHWLQSRSKPPTAFLAL